MLDEEYENFVMTNTIGDELLSSSNEHVFGDIPESSQLHISTTTRIGYLTDNHIDLYSLFWKIPIISYSTESKGILKKQMKFNMTSITQLQSFLEKLNTLRSTEIIEEQIISRSDSLNTRIKFKDVRKITVGISSKDILLRKFRKKSAFYNCLVIIVRILRDSTFKEYHVKIFNTGKMEIPGIQDDSEFIQLMDFVVTILNNYIPNISQIESNDVVLINSNFNCGYYLKRDKLYDILRTKYNLQCVYDPCSYPGIQCKFFYKKGSLNQNGVQDYEDIKGRGYGYMKHNRTGEELHKSKIDTKKESKYIQVSIMIFRTGSILIVGMSTKEIIIEIYNFLRMLMQTECENIREQSGILEKKKEGFECRKLKIKFINVAKQN